MLAIGLVATVLWMMTSAARSADATAKPNFWWHVLQLLLALCAMTGLSTGIGIFIQNRYGHGFDTPLILGMLALIFASVIGMSVYAQRWKQQR